MPVVPGSGSSRNSVTRLASFPSARRRSQRRRPRLHPHPPSLPAATLAVFSWLVRRGCPFHLLVRLFVEQLTPDFSPDTEGERHVLERILAKAAAGDVPPEIAAQPHYAGGVQVAEPPP